MRQKFTSFLCMICLISFSGILQAQTADKILKQYIKATGSKKYKKLETIKMIGDLPTPQGSFPIEIYVKRPNKVKTQLDIPGMGLMVPSAYDGETAWMINPMMGATTPQKFPEEGALLIADQSQFDPIYINYAKKGYTIVLDGSEDVNGKKCHKLKIENELGVQYHYFDMETYFLLKVNSKGADGSTSDTYFDNYKETEFGIMMPFSWEIESQMGLQPIEFIEIIANEPIGDDEFAFPGG